jgi:tripartite-type tricarboxylate transporter receptor subunit TctC
MKFARIRAVLVDARACCSYPLLLASLALTAPTLIAAEHTPRPLSGVGASPVAESYPVRPVRVIVPVTAGSTTDVLARLVSQKLSELWAQPAVVDNRTGAGGTIGAGLVAKAPQDGYTLLIYSNAFTQIPALYANLPYDMRNSFTAVSALVTSPYVLVVGPPAGVRTIAELIAAAKAKPGQLTFGSAGAGTGTHFAAEKFKHAAGIEVVHVPYKGGPEATTDTMTGRVTYWFPPIGIALPFVRDNKLLALGVTSARRTSLLPNVPTFAESGLAGYEDAIWFGMWAPAGTPTAVIDKVGKDVARALASADMREKLLNLGMEPMRLSPAEFAQLVRAETESSGRIITALGIKAQ